MMISKDRYNSVFRQFLLSLCIFLLAAAYPGETGAATNRGVYFEDEIIIGSRQLSLHGIGLLKWKYLVNVYLVGLYKPAEVPVDQVLQDVPKSLEFYFFVDMKAKDFKDTGLKLMSQNVGAEKANSLLTELEKFNSFYRDVSAGQRYVFTYIPGQGIEMTLEEEVLGKVESDAFAAAYMSIWLGPVPVSKSLQEGLFNPATRME
ncbi:MAG: chalcone isomerase family protein [Desulfobulbales bacterium]|nr:chalcone isomerase family protein [Desulfobulbales bacterium]